MISFLFILNTEVKEEKRDEWKLENNGKTKEKRTFSEIQLNIMAINIDVDDLNLTKNSTAATQ